MYLSINHNPELDITVYEDIKHLSVLWQRDDLSNADIRNSSHILRRLLIYNDLQKSANSRHIKLTIEAPNNKSLITATRNNVLEFFQSAGTTVFGVWLRASTVSKGSAEKLNSIFKDFNPDDKIELNLSSFLKQPVFSFKGDLIARADVIKYVANKAGGPHFDANRADKDKILDHIRSAILMKMENGTPTFGFDISKFSEPQNSFSIVNGSIDPVFVEMAAACRYLTESTSIQHLVQVLEQEYGL